MLRRRKFSWLIVIGLFLTLVGNGSINHAVGAPTRYEITHRRKLADGLWVKWIRDNQRPNRIKVLTLNPSSALTLDVALANGRLPGRETTRSMARRHGAIAAVNGTFGLPWGRPIGIFVEDSFIKASPLLWGNGFALSQDEQAAYIGHPNARVTMTGTGDGSKSVIWAWNEPGLPPAPLLGYTKEGGRFASPPGNACSARLIDQGIASWGENNDGVQREYQVDDVGCADTPMPRAGGTVISAPLGSRLIDRITALQEGQLVQLTWSVGWPGALDAIAGNPVLVADGRNVAYECPNPFCQKNPRTGIGVTRSGRILLVTVDGRQPRRSRGMTLWEFARFFRILGATEARNLDGGGSTTMVVNGSVINMPSDPGGQRAVSSSILIVPGSDSGEPPVLPHIPTAGSSPLSPADPVDTRRPVASFFGPRAERDAAVRDAGSTGGLLDALSRRRSQTGRHGLAPSLLRIAERFEAFRTRD